MLHKQTFLVGPTMGDTWHHAFSDRMRWPHPKCADISSQFKILDEDIRITLKVEHGGPWRTLISAEEVPEESWNSLNWETSKGMILSGDHQE